MTREQFENLKVGDYVYHGFGHIGRIMSIDGGGYVVRGPSFNTGDGMTDVSFAWNEGEPCPNYNGPEIKMEKDAYLSRAMRRAKNKKVRFKMKKLLLLILSAFLLSACQERIENLEKVLYITCEGDTLVTYGGRIVHYSNGRSSFIAPQRIMDYNKKSNE